MLTGDAIKYRDIEAGFMGNRWNCFIGPQTLGISLYLSQCGYLMYSYNTPIILFIIFKWGDIVTCSRPKHAPCSLVNMSLNSSSYATKSIKTCLKYPFPKDCRSDRLQWKNQQRGAYADGGYMLDAFRGSASPRSHIISRHASCAWQILFNIAQHLNPLEVSMLKKVRITPKPLSFLYF